MTFEFSEAVRQDVHLLIGIAGGTGAGKSWSALELATGLSGGKPFAAIDTEEGRMLHYAPGPGEPVVAGKNFAFKHTHLRAPFRPSRYLEAIKAAEAAGYGVIVIDSMSHEHAGEGGLLDWHEEELDRMAKGDWAKRESCNMTAWIKPKMEHKEMVSHLLQIKAHVIFCFRAEEKIEMAKNDKGKMEVRKKETPTSYDGWVPISEKRLPYEMTASFLMKAENPGVPLPIKLEAQHRPFFPLDRQLSREAGALLAKWAKGEAPPARPALSSILTAIKIAENLSQLDAVKDSAGQLTGEDKTKAIAAFKAKRDTFTFKAKRDTFK